MGWAAEQPHGVGNGVGVLQNRGCGIGGNLFYFSFWASSAQPCLQQPTSHGALNSISWCCACHARSRIVVFSFFFLFACVRACRSHNRRGRTTRSWKEKKIITSEGRLTPCVWYLHAGKAVPSRAQRVPSCMIPTAAAAVVRGCRDMQC